MGLFSRRPKDPPEKNTAFSVVSGDLRLPSGQVVPYRTIVPTVYGASGWFIGNGVTDAVSSGPAPAEMAWMARDLAVAEYPGSVWLDEDGVTCREATPEETEWALANGVNERWGG